jgi:hypothetical protein
MARLPMFSSRLLRFLVRLVLEGCSLDATLTGVFAIRSDAVGP